MQPSDKLGVNHIPPQSRKLHLLVFSFTAWHLHKPKDTVLISVQPCYSNHCRGSRVWSLHSDDRQKKGPKPPVTPIAFLLSSSSRILSRINAAVRRGAID